MQEEKIIFPTSDGIELAGILETPMTESKKVIVLCHGITVNKNEGGMFVMLSEKLTEAGFTVFRFDFRGHGESGGRSIDMSISGEVKDTESAIAFLEKRGYTAFGLLGASFGGGIVSLYTGEHAEKIKALALWNGLLDYSMRLTPKTVYGKKYFGQPALDRINKLGFTEVGSKMFRVGKKVFDEMAVLEPWKEIVDLDLPILLVHGNKDTYIDYHDSVKYSLLMKNAQLEIIRGAEHGFHDHDEHAKEAIDTTVDFFSKNL